MWLMMQCKKPDDYVIATKKQHSIRDFLKLAFNEVGIKNWKKYVKIDEKFLRPLDVKSVCGDFKKAKKNLGWTPKTNFKEIVKLMVYEDLKRHDKLKGKIKIVNNVKNKNNFYDTNLPKIARA